MISIQNKELHINSPVNNILTIAFPLNDDIDTITSENIESESMEIYQAVYDGSGLKFGGCISSEFDVDVFNTAERSFDTSLEGEWIAVKMNMQALTPLYPSDTLYPSTSLYPGHTIVSDEILLFAGKIDSVTTDRNNKHKKHIKAYDLMKDLLEKDCTDIIYNGFIHSQVTYHFYALFEVLLANNSYPYERGTFFDEVYDPNDLTKTLANRNILNDKWDYLQESPTIGSVLRYMSEAAGVFCVVKPTDDAVQGDLENDQNKYLGLISFITYGTAAETYSRYESFYDGDGATVGGYNHLIFNNHYSYPSSSSQTDPWYKKSTYALYQNYDPDTDPRKDYSLYHNPLIWDNVAGSSNSELALFARSTGIHARFSKAVPAVELVAPGRPWVEVGDKIIVNVIRTNPDGSYVYNNNQLVVDQVVSWVLSKRTKGIIALSDTITVRGE